MKQKETSLNSQENEKMMFEEMGEEHMSTAVDTPLRADAFEKDDDLKIELIEKHFRPTWWK